MWIVKYWFQHTATRRWLPAVCAACLSSRKVSTHSHPKVAARRRRRLGRRKSSFNTQPPEGGCSMIHGIHVYGDDVSTHSHPKVAAWIGSRIKGYLKGFNTQPPEGGCRCLHPPRPRLGRFNTQPPEGGCPRCFSRHGGCVLFQHTATRRWLQPPSKALLHQVSQPRFR